MDIYDELSNTIVNMDEERAIELSKLIVDEKMDILEAINRGVTNGMKIVSELYEDGEYFIPELLTCADVMYSSLDILNPHLPRESIKEKHKIVIGSIKGDTHDIGKNIVALILESSGFKVYNLGRDVSPREFVDNALKYNAQIIAISTLMTTTMENMGDVIKLLEEEGIRDRFKVIVGGKPLSKSFADSIGADGYSSDAMGAVRLVKSLIN